MTDKAAGPDGSALSEGLGAGAEALERFDVVLATFQPRRTDDLKKHARAWIGVRMRWCAGWEIDAEDGGPYAGQMAMTPHEPTPAGLEPIGWVPFCDLADVDAPNVRAKPPSAAQRSNDD
jgi:hypothetical protein